MSISLPNKAVDTLGTLLTLLANSGTDPYQDEEQLAPRAVALEKLALLMRLTEASPPEAFSWNPILLLEHMAEHDDVVYCPMLFGYSNYSRPGFRRKLVRFRPVPSAGLGPRGGVIGGAGLSVSSRCRELDAARAYAEYVASPEVQRTLYVEAGGQPGHRAAWIDPHANELSCLVLRRHAAGPRRRLPASAVRRRTARPERRRQHGLGVAALGRRSV